MQEGIKLKSAQDELIAADKNHAKLVTEASVEPNKIQKMISVVDDDGSGTIDYKRFPELIADNGFNSKGLDK